MAWVGNVVQAPGAERARSLGGRMAYYSAVEIPEDSQPVAKSEEDRVVRVNDIVEVASFDNLAVEPSGTCLGYEQQPFLAQIEAFWEDGFTGMKQCRARWLLRASEASRIVQAPASNSSAAAGSDSSPTTKSEHGSLDEKADRNGPVPTKSPAIDEPAVSSDGSVVSASQSANAAPTKTPNKKSAHDDNLRSTLAVQTGSSAMEGNDGGIEQEENIIPKFDDPHEIVLTAVADDIDVRAIIGLAPVTTPWSSPRSIRRIASSQRNPPKFEPRASTAGKGSVAGEERKLTLSRAFDPCTCKCSKLDADHPVMERLRARSTAQSRTETDGDDNVGTDGVTVGSFSLAESLRSGSEVFSSSPAVSHNKADKKPNNNNSSSSSNNKTNNNNQRRSTVKGSCASGTRGQSRSRATRVKGSIAGGSTGVARSMGGSNKCFGARSVAERKGLAAILKSLPLGGDDGAIDETGGRSEGGVEQGKEVSAAGSMNNDAATFSEEERRILRNIKKLPYKRRAASLARAMQGFLRGDHGKARSGSSGSIDPHELGRNTRRKTTKSLPPPPTRSSARFIPSSPAPLPSALKRPRRLRMPPDDMPQYFGAISGNGAVDDQSNSAANRGVAAAKRGRPRGSGNKSITGSKTKEILPSTTQVGAAHQVDIPDLLPQADIDAAKEAGKGGTVGCELVWRSTAEWAPEEKSRLGRYLRQAKKMLHDYSNRQPRAGVPVLMNLAAGDCDAAEGSGAGEDRKMAWALTCSGLKGDGKEHMRAGCSENEIFQVPRSALQSAQTEEAALHALLKSNDCNLEDTKPALEQLMTSGNECGELTTWTFSQVRALQEAMEKEVEDKPKDPNEADPDDYIDLCDVSISVPGKTPQEVIAFYFRFVAAAKTLTDVHDSPEAAKMRAEREAAMPHVSPPPKKTQTRHTPPPTLRHRPSLRQPPRLSYEHQPRVAGNRTRNEREHMNLPLALRKSRREAAVKGCRKVTSLVAGNSSGSTDSDSSSGSASDSEQEEPTLPRKRSRNKKNETNKRGANLPGAKGADGKAIQRRSNKKQAVEDGKAEGKRSRARGSSSASEAGSSVATSSGGGGSKRRGSLRTGPTAGDRAIQAEKLSRLSVGGYPPLRRSFDVDNAEFGRVGSSAQSGGCSDRTAFSERTGMSVGRVGSMYMGGIIEDPLRKRREVGWGRDYDRVAFVGEMRDYKLPIDDVRGYESVGWRGAEELQGSSRGVRRGEGRRVNVRAMPPGAVILEVSDDGDDQQSAHGYGRGSSSKGRMAAASEKDDRGYMSKVHLSDRERGQFFSRGYDPGVSDVHMSSRQCPYSSTDQRYAEPHQHPLDSGSASNMLSPSFRVPPSSTFHAGGLTHAAGFGCSQRPQQYPPSDIAAAYDHGVGRSSSATAGWSSGPDRVGCFESRSAFVGAASYSCGSDPSDRETGHYGSGSGFAYGEAGSGGGSGGRSSCAGGAAGGPGAGGAGQGGGERVGGCAGSSRSRRRGDRGAGDRDEASRCQSPMSSCWFLLDEAQRFLDTERIRYLEGLLVTHSRRKMTYAQLEERAASCLYDKPDILASFKRIFKLMDVALPLNTERHQHIQPTTVDTARAANSKNITADRQLLVARPLVLPEDEIAPTSEIAMLPTRPPPVSTSEISRMDCRKSTAFTPLVHRRSSPPSSVAARATSSLSNATSRGASPQAAEGVRGTDAKSRAAGAMHAPDQRMTYGRTINSSMFSPAFVDLTVDSRPRSLASSAADATATAPSAVASAVHAVDRTWATGLRAGNDRISADQPAVGGALKFGTPSDASSKVDNPTKGGNTISAAAAPAASASFATTLQKGGGRGSNSVVPEVARAGNGRTAGADVVECRVASGVSAARPAEIECSAPVKVSKSPSHAATPSPGVIAPTTKTTTNTCANRPDAPKDSGPSPSQLSGLGTDRGVADNNTSVNVPAASHVANPSGENPPSSQREFTVVSFCGGARQTTTGRSAGVSRMADSGGSRSTAPTIGITAKPLVSAEPRSARVGAPAPLSGKKIAPAAGAASGAAVVPTPAPATVTAQPSVVRPPSGMMGAVFPPIPASKIGNTSWPPQSASGISSSSVSSRKAIGAPTGGGKCSSTRATPPAAAHAPVTALVPSPTQGANTGTTSFAENAAIIEQGRAMACAKFADIRYARAIENREIGAQALITNCLRDEHATVVAKAKALAKAAFADGRFARAVENGENAARASIESVQRYVKRTNEAAASAPRTPPPAGTEAETTGISPSDQATSRGTFTSPKNALQSATAQANPDKRLKKEGPAAAAAETVEGATVPVAEKAVDHSAAAASRRQEDETSARGPSGLTSSAAGATGQRVRGGALLSWFGYGKGGGDRS